MKLNKIRDLSEQDLTKDKIISEDFLLHSDDKGLEVVYAPFDHINRIAKVVIIGITPGWTQLEASYRYIIQNKETKDDVLLKRVKNKASFSGSMRKNLISWLDGIGVYKSLSIKSSAELFNDLNQNTLHTTSVLRFPVFINKNNYSGHNPKILSNSYFRNQIDCVFTPELEKFSNSLIIPLGSAVQTVINYIRGNEMINHKYILEGFPHPSTLNVGSDKLFKERKDSFLKVVTRWRNNV